MACCAQASSYATVEQTSTFTRCDICVLHASDNGKLLWMGSSTGSNNEHIPQMHQQCAC